MNKINVYKIIAALAAAIVFVAGCPAFAGTTTYKYDAHGRVVEIDYPDGSVIKYTYDSAGNRTQVTR